MNPTPRSELQQALELVKRRQFSEAETVYGELIAKGQDVAESFYGLGYIRVEKGEHDAARNLLESCIKLEPHHPNAHYYLAFLARKGNDLPSTRAYLRKVLEIEPRHAGAKRMLDALPVQPGEPEVVTPNSAPSGGPIDGSAPPGTGIGDAPVEGNDLYALLRKSKEPVEIEIAGRLDRIAKIIGKRRVRVRAFLGPLLLIWLLYIGIALAADANHMRNQEKDLLTLGGLLLVGLLTLAVIIRAKSCSIWCYRDILMTKSGVLSTSAPGVHMFILSKKAISVEQSAMNRLTGDGTLTFNRIEFKGFFEQSELAELAEHFRQLGLLTPTSRNVLAAMGELRNIRSGA